jgi:hypothetical protein
LPGGQPIAQGVGKSVVDGQIVINANNRRAIAVGPCRPGNRNDVVVARRTVAYLLDGTRPILGDRGYRGIDTITSPRPATDSPDHPRPANTGESAPASNTSSPGAKTGKSCGNANDAAKPSTTASTSSPDSGTSRPVDNYGSTLSCWGVANCCVHIPSVDEHRD